jgi:uncharacterized lipoprotein YajG
MKKLFLLLILISLNVYSQEVKINAIHNKIELGPLAGNRDLSFGVSNILEEVLQDKGYDLTENSDIYIDVDLLYFDVRKTSMQIAVASKKTDLTEIIAKASLFVEGRKIREVTARGTAKAITTSTLIISNDGKFSQANVSTAIKKLCVQLIDELKI